MAGMLIQSMGERGEQAFKCNCRYDQTLAVVLPDGWVRVTKRGLEIEFEPECAFAIRCPVCKQGWYVDRNLHAVVSQRPIARPLARPLIVTVPTGKFAVL